MRKLAVILFVCFTFFILTIFIYERLTFNSIINKCVRDDNGDYIDSKYFDACVRNLTFADKFRYGFK